MIGVSKNHGKIIHENYLKVIVKDLQNQISDNYNEIALLKNEIKKFFKFTLSRYQSHCCSRLRNNT